MSLLNAIQLGATVATSIFLVFLVIVFGWFLIWKAFLSKFRLVRELLGQSSDDSSSNLDKQNKTTSKVKKIRKD